MKAVLTDESLLSHPDTGGVVLVSSAYDTVWSEVAAETTLTSGMRARSARGELLILAEPFPWNPWQQDALLRTVHARGYSGLACPGAQRADRGVKRLCDVLSFTLFDAVKPFALAQACWQILSARDALVLQYVRKVAQATQYRAQNISDLLAHFGVSVGHNVAVIDEHGVLAAHGAPLPDILRERIDASRWLSVVSAGSRVAASVRIDTPGNLKRRLIVHGAHLVRTQVQALATAAEIMVPAVAARLLIDEHQIMSAQAEQSRVWREFLSEPSLTDAILTRMREHGWETTGFHLGFQLSSLSSDVQVVFREIQRMMAEVRELGGIVMHDDHVIGWLTFQDPQSPTNLRRSIAVLRSIHGALRHRSVSMGVGSVEHGAAGLRTTIRQAAESLAIAARRSNADYFMQFEDYGVEEQILALAENETFLVAAESLLEPVKDQPELLRTLTQFLDHGQSVQLTAAAMDVHRNTIATRLQRAENLLGIDLREMESRLALHLACRALVSAKPSSSLN